MKHIAPSTTKLPLKASLSDNAACKLANWTTIFCIGEPCEQLPIHERFADKCSLYP